MTRQTEPSVRTRRRPLGVACIAALVAAGCGALAPLAQLVQPPRFAQAPDRPAEIRLMPPSRSNRAGAAGVTVWLEVTNPNPFGFTLSTLTATLLLEGSRAGTGDFPLGLPLGAGQQSVVPVDLAISFADVPGLSTAIQRALAGQAVQYELQGTVGIDAGRLGQPTFGPMTLVAGDLSVAGALRR